MIEKRENTEKWEENICNCIKKKGTYPVSDLAKKKFNRLIEAKLDKWWFTVVHPVPAYQWVCSQGCLISYLELERHFPMCWG